MFRVDSEAGGNIISNKLDGPMMTGQVNPHLCVCH